MHKNSTKRLARAGIVAALYVVLSLVGFPVASGGVQFRLAEGLAILPLFFPETVVALFIGCFLSNLITGCAILDVVFGSLITLISALLTFAVGKAFKGKGLRFILGGIFPVILNAFLLPLVWFYCYGKLEYLYIVQAAFLLVGQALSVYAVGGIIYFYLNKISGKGIDFLQ